MPGKIINQTLYRVAQASIEVGGFQDVDLLLLHRKLEINSVVRLLKPFGLENLHVSYTTLPSPPHCCEVSLYTNDEQQDWR